MIMFDGLITLILPCYKAERYIANMIECVFAQTYQKWELLIVSNGPSQERQLQIINEYLHKDSRITCISVQEPGLSNARNVGIIAAKGVFFSFVDADDSISPDHLQNFISVIDEDSELIIGGYTLFRSKEKEKTQLLLDSYDSNCEAEGIIDGRRRYCQMEETTASASWNKLHKTELVRRLALKYNTTFTTYEDTDFYLSLMLSLSRIQFIPMCGYFYVCADEGSIQSKWHYDLEYIFEILKKKKRDLRQLSGISKETIEHESLKQCYMDCYWLVCNFFKPGCPLSLKSKYKEIKRLVNSLDFCQSLPLQDYSKHNKLLKLFDFAISTKSPLFVTVFFWLQYKIKSTLGSRRGTVMKYLRK